MGRQTVFPGLMVDRIEARQFGRAVDTVHEQGAPLKNVAERAKSLIQFLNPLFDEDFVLEYDISIAAYSQFSAKTKARVYVRMKNPFEPDIIDITSVEKIRNLPASKAGRNLYEITVEVKK